MSKFDSSNFNTGSNGISKILKPGTHYCKIADVQVSVPSYNMNALTVTYILVGPDLPDFEGMVIDKMNPSLGTYKGQAAYVRAGKYAFSDYVPPKGPKQERDQIIFKSICNLAHAIGVDVTSLGIKGDTIEEFIDNLKPYLISAGYFYVTIAGQEKTTEYGKNYNMYLPKNEKDSLTGKYLSPYFKDEAGLKDSDLEGKMVLFKESKHIDLETPISLAEYGKEEGFKVNTSTGSILRGTISSGSTTTTTVFSSESSPNSFSKGLL